MSERTPSVAPCTMQIPITDRDEPFARHILPHQMEVLGRHAADVLISVNRQQQPEDPGPLDALIERVRSMYPNVRCLEVDYSEGAQRWVSETFFGGGDYPLYDFKGIPIHAFLEQYRQSEHRYFFHLASDMMLGGRGPWFDEAIGLLDARPGILAINPLAGPRLPGPYHSKGRPIDCEVGECFEVPTFTGRTHLVDLERFLSTMGDLPLIAPSRLLDRLQTKIAGHPMVEHLEILFQHNMQAEGLMRADMGGSGGLWTLHPVHKTAEFAAGVASVISALERDDVPAGQRGKFDLHQSMLPQSDIPDRWDKTLRLAQQGSTRLVGAVEDRIRRSVRSRSRRSV